MQFSIGVEYALHSLLCLVNLPAGTNLGIKDIASYQNVSETYLSKIFTHLAKADIVRSSPGVKGGYELAHAPQDITFWDVVEAIEGRSHLFRCKNIRKDCWLYSGQGPHTWPVPTGICTIHEVMLQAEELMQQHLRSKTLFWLSLSLEEKLPIGQREDTRDWLQEVISRRE